MHLTHATAFFCSLLLFANIPRGAGRCATGAGTGRRGAGRPRRAALRLALWQPPSPAGDTAAGLAAPAAALRVAGAAGATTLLAHEVLLPGYNHDRIAAIADANYGGTEGDLAYAGGPVLVGPDGAILAMAGSASALLVADLPEVVDPARLSTQAADFRPVTPCGTQTGAPPDPPAPPPATRSCSSRCRSASRSRPWRSGQRPCGSAAPRPAARAKSPARRWCWSVRATRAMRSGMIPAPPTGAAPGSWASG